jgi:Raf kinase inhibitor-like YbhB/YbcL family protein
MLGFGPGALRGSPEPGGEKLMRLWSGSFRNGEAIPARYALGRPHPETHVQLSDNLNPHLAWADVPAGTRSFALVCHDVDVPTRPDDVNKEGVTVPADLPRTDFYHWVLVDLPAERTAIAEGEFSRGVTPKGKPGPEGPQGTRQGLNDYTQWFEGDTQMGGNYFGYDGPGPPWNDELVHHYHFTLYALDVARCPVEGPFTGPDALKAIEGRTLAQASLVGTYAIYPKARTR